MDIASWNDGIGMSSLVGVRHGAPDSLLLYHLLDLLLLLRLSPIRQQRVVLVFIPDEKVSKKCKHSGAFSYFLKRSGLEPGGR